MKSYFKPFNPFPGVAGVCAQFSVSFAFLLAPQTELMGGYENMVAWWIFEI
jgi:hypothetical protein